MFQMMGVFAEFERAMIQERVRAGLARAKSEGRLWRLLEGPACVRSPRSLGSILALCRGSAALSRQAPPTREGSPLGQLAHPTIWVSSSKSAVGARWGRHGPSAVGRLKVLAADPSGRWRPVTPGYPYPFVAGHVAAAMPNAVLGGDTNGLARTQLVLDAKLSPWSFA